MFEGVVQQARLFGETDSQLPPLPDSAYGVKRMPVLVLSTVGGRGCVVCRICCGVKHCQTIGAIESDGTKPLATMCWLSSRSASFLKTEAGFFTQSLPKLRTNWTDGESRILIVL